MALQPRRRLHACGRESRVPRVAGLKSDSCWAVVRDAAPAAGSHLKPWSQKSLPRKAEHFFKGAPSDGVMGQE